MKLLFTLLLTILVFNLHGQTTLSGKVVDKKGKPLQGVNISILNSYDGATTDSFGNFSFKTRAKGELSIQADIQNYLPQSKTLSLNGTGQLEVIFILREEITTLRTVTITAGVLDQKKISALNPIDVVTVAGSNGDITGALKTLPGTQQINDREGLFVRGGTGSETQQFIDGALVRNAFQTALPDLGSRGRFSPFLFKGTVFSPGGYSALYGQGLSGAIILNSIDLPEKSSGFWSLSSVGAGLGYQQLSKNKKFSYGFNYNYVNLNLYFKIVPQLIKFYQSPNYHTLDGNFRYKTKKGLLKFYGSSNLGDMGIFRSNLDSFDFNSQQYFAKNAIGLNNQNVYLNLSYKAYFDNKWILEAVTSLSNNQDEFQFSTEKTNISKPENTTSITKSINGFQQFRWVLQKDLAKQNAIRFGTDFQHSKDQFKVSYPPFVNYQKVEDYYSSIFGESDIYLSNNFGIKAGVRAEYSNVLKAINFAPRMSLAYRISEGNELSAAYGDFYQKPDSRFLYTNTLKFMKAKHYILTYSKTSKGRLLRTEAFYKKYKNLIAYNSSLSNNNSNLPITNISNDGFGDAYGIEFYFRDKTTIKGLDYWISYSYLNTKRKFNNYPILTQPDFAANHTASLVLKKYWDKINFGVNLSYNISSGRPYFNPNLYYDSTQTNYPNNFMVEKTPIYNSLNLSCNYIRQIKNVFSVFVLSVSNVLNQTQIYGYNYAIANRDPNGYLHNQPINPGARQFVFLGAFFSWGIDRSNDAINNNL